MVGTAADDPGRTVRRVDPEEYAERVLRCVEAVPPGRVTTYGTIAEALGVGGPRQVGAVLAREGGGVPWWRVVRADGSLPPSHGVRARERYREEGTPLRSSDRVDVAAALWAPAPPPDLIRDCCPGDRSG